MRPQHLPRRIRRNTKTLDAMKAGVVIFALLVTCIFAVWIASQLLRQPTPPPDLTPRPGQSLWETPPPTH